MIKVQQMTQGQTIIVLVIGAVLFAGGFVGGFLMQNYTGTRAPLNENPPQAVLENLAIESYTPRLFTKLAIQFNLRNTGTTNIQITDVRLNGHSNQTAYGLNEGWNGTTLLYPNQNGSLYVYSLCYMQAVNESMPTLSATPTQTELENFETWSYSFNCTFTIVTNTTHQYNCTMPGLGFGFYYALTLWSGSLTYTFMATEQVQITNIAFGSPGASGWIAVTVNNTGTSPVTINEAWINNLKQTSFNTNQAPGNIAANAGVVINMTSYNLVNGNNYQVKLVSSKGNQFMYSAVAPTQ